MRQASGGGGGFAVPRRILAQAGEASMGKAEGDGSFAWGGVFTDAVA